MTTPTGGRSAADVLDDHLRLADEGRVDDDISRNYHPEVVVLWRDGVERGLAGLKRLADLLDDELPGARFTYVNRVVEGEVAFLEWTATAASGVVRDGADSFLIRDGRIVAQTIHYTVEPR